MDAKALLRETLDILKREVATLEKASKSSALDDIDSGKLCDYIKVLSVLSKENIGEDNDTKLVSNAELSKLIAEAISARQS
jgi:hypothetical protein